MATEKLQQRNRKKIYKQQQNWYAVGSIHTQFIYIDLYSRAFK